MVCKHHVGNAKMSSKLPRPPASVVEIECDHCDVKVNVSLQWWRCVNDGCDGKWWVRDKPENIDRNERLCAPCLDSRLKVHERAREYECSTPPSDFDPTFCGERWDDDY